MTSRKRNFSVDSLFSLASSPSKGSGNRGASKASTYRKRRKNILEKLESRQLLAVGPPQLIAVQPNVGELITDGSTINASPSTLRLNFDDGQQIDPNTLGAVSLSRAGEDGQIGTIDDVTVELGDVGIDPAKSNTVLVRFKERLQDDQYRLAIQGYDDPASGIIALANLEGDPIAISDVTSTVAVENTDFRLSLGGLVEAVVPQPIIRRDDGRLVQNRDEILVYFNHDPLFTEEVTVTGEPTIRSAEHPRFYQLLFTNETLRTTDDLVYQPTEVIYDPVTSTARLIFDTDLAELGQPDLQFLPEVGDPDRDAMLAGVPIGGGTFRLRIGEAVDERVDLILKPEEFDVAASVKTDLGEDGLNLKFVSKVLQEAGSGLQVRFTNDQDPSFPLAVNVTAALEVTPAGGDVVVFYLNDQLGNANADIQSLTDAIATNPAVDLLLTLDVLAGDVTTVLPDRLDGAPALQLTAVGDTLSTSLDVGVFDGTQAITNLVISESVDLQSVFYRGVGSDADPGHDLVSHINPNFGFDQKTGVTTIPYNFKGVYGTQGDSFFLNQISEEEKQRVREAIDSWSRQAGVQFVETVDHGFTFAKGSITTTPSNTSVVGDLEVAVRIDPSISDPAAILPPDSMVIFGIPQEGSDFDDSDTDYGESFTRRAVAAIGLMLGLEYAPDLVSSNIMAFDPVFLAAGDDQWNGSALDDLEPVFPGGADIFHARYVHQTDSVDVDLYRFEVAMDDEGREGNLSIETFAERLPDASPLDTSLALYEENQASAITDFGLGNNLRVRFDSLLRGRHGNFSRVNFTSSPRVVGDDGLRVFQGVDRSGNPLPNTIGVDIPLGFPAGTFTVADLVDAINDDPFASSIFRAEVINGDDTTDIIGVDVELFSPVELQGGGLEKLQQNDDYFSEDSRLRAVLGDGIYYVGVSASGNSEYDPAIAGSGYGGRTEGEYQLQITYEPQVSKTDVIRDLDAGVDGVPGTFLDGDNDGLPGGVHNFWFQSRPEQRLMDVVSDGSNFTDGQVLTLLSADGAERRYEFCDNFRAPAFGNIPINYNTGAGGFPITSRADMAVRIQAAINSQTGIVGQPTYTGISIPNAPDPARPVLGLLGERSMVLSEDFSGIALIGKTIFVDKVSVLDSDGSLEKPFNYINGGADGGGFGASQPGDVIRIVGNGGVDGDITTPADAYSYQIGFGEVNGQVLEDGANLNVPRDVTVMIESGAALKFRSSFIQVGSSNLLEDRSEAVVQILGTPRFVTISESADVATDPLPQLLQGNGSNGVSGFEDGKVILTSTRDRSVDINSVTSALPVSPGDWGGVIFRDDRDRSEGRFGYEEDGAFLQRVNHADIRYGGGSNVLIDSVQQLVNPVQIMGMMPTVSFNHFYESADAALSATPNSFEELSFQTPFLQADGSFIADYDRVGPDVLGNLLLNNSINGMMIRVSTTVTEPTEVLTVAARLDDTEVVHYLPENLGIVGTPGGNVQDDFVPRMVSVTGQILSGGQLGAQNLGDPDEEYLYRVSFVDAYGFESRASDEEFGPVVVPFQDAGSSIELTNLASIASATAGQYVSRRLYRSNDAGVSYQLVARLDGQSESYLDDGSLAGGTLDTGRQGIRGRFDASLVMDAGLILKARGSRLELGQGTQFLAEGTQQNPIVLTSAFDDRHGIGGTVDTNNSSPGADESDPIVANRGDWAGVYAHPGANVSFDNVSLSYAGGISLLEGGFGAGFAPLELHQAEARITNSIFEFNDDGFADNNQNGLNDEGIAGAGPEGRFGRLSFAPSTIFIRGSQPVIVGNYFIDNRGSTIDINIESMTADLRRDGGRQTGFIDRLTSLDDNVGPLVRDNQFFNVASTVEAEKQLSGLEVRAGEISEETSFDDAGIAHLVFDDVIVGNVHSSGGLNLLSRFGNSLVVKFDGSGIVATGQNTLNPAIGGTVHVLGQPGSPVVLTSLEDDSVASGAQVGGASFGDHDGDGIAFRPLPGDWRGLMFDGYSNDFNMGELLEFESSTVVGPGLNATVANAQYIGELARNTDSGDYVRRLGYTVNGYLSSFSDVDTYSFTGSPGTEIWLDVDGTSFDSDLVVEVLDVNGNVLTRSDNSFFEVPSSGLEAVVVFDEELEGVAGSLQSGLLKYASTNERGEFKDFGSVSERDPGLHFPLLGDRTDPTARNEYFVRVRSASDDPDDATAGLTRGPYELNLRTKQEQLFPGSVVRHSEISYAENALHFDGLMTESPMLGEAVEHQEDVPFYFLGPYDNSFQDGLLTNNDVRYREVGDGAQYLGNILDNGKGVLSVAGSLNDPLDVDFYRFDAFTSVEDVLSAMVFDIDYADQFGRPDANVSVFFQPDYTKDADYMFLDDPTFANFLEYQSNARYKRFYAPGTDEHPKVSGFLSPSTNAKLVYFGSAANVADDLGSPNGVVDLTERLRGGSASKRDTFIGPVGLGVVERDGSVGQIQHGTYYVAVSSSGTDLDPADPWWWTNEGVVPGAMSSEFTKREPVNSVARLVEDRFEVAPDISTFESPQIDSGFFNALDAGFVFADIQAQAFEGSNFALPIGKPQHFDGTTELPEIDTAGPELTPAPFPDLPVPFQESADTATDITNYDWRLRSNPAIFDVLNGTDVSIEIPNLSFAGNLQRDFADFYSVTVTETSRLVVDIDSGWDSRYGDGGTRATDKAANTRNLDVEMYVLRQLGPGNYEEVVTGLPLAAFINPAVGHINPGLVPTNSGPGDLAGTEPGSNSSLDPYFAGTVGPGTYVIGVLNQPPSYNNADPPELQYGVAMRPDGSVTSNIGDTADDAWVNNNFTSGSLLHQNDYIIHIAAENQDVADNAVSRALTFDPRTLTPAEAASGNKVITSQAIDLRGYAASDMPYLYFNQWFDETQNVNATFRLESTDPDGNPFTAGAVGFDDFQDPFEDASQKWRQRRIPLVDYAGHTNVQMVVEMVMPGPGFDTGVANELLRIDDLIVGFAERGETVFYAPQSTRFEIPAGLENVSDTAGAYQLEMRVVDSYITLDNGGLPAQLVSTMDTNERGTDAVTLVMPAPSAIDPGGKLALSDGIRTQIFEFYDSVAGASSDVDFGNIPIGFDPAGSRGELLRGVRDAINSQTIVLIEAATASGVDETLESTIPLGDANYDNQTDGRLNLFGARGGSFHDLQSYRDLAPALDVGKVRLNADGMLEFPAVLSTGSSDVNYERLQSQVLVEHNSIHDAEHIGIWWTSGQRLSDWDYPTAEGNASQLQQVMANVGQRRSSLATVYDPTTNPFASGAGFALAGGDNPTYTNFQTTTDDYLWWSDRSDIVWEYGVPVGQSAYGGTRNLPATADSVSGGLVPGVAIQSNVIDAAAYAGIKIDGDAEPWMLQVFDTPDPDSPQKGDGNDVADGWLLTVDAGGTRVIFEFDDKENGPEGVAAGHVPIAYRTDNDNHANGPATETSQLGLYQTIAKSINESVLGRGGGVPLVTASIGRALNNPDDIHTGFPSSWGPDVGDAVPGGAGFFTAQIFSNALYLSGASGVYLSADADVDNPLVLSGSLRTTPPESINLSARTFSGNNQFDSLPHATSPQLISKVVNNTIYGMDGLSSANPELPPILGVEDESLKPNDLFVDAIDTRLGASHNDEYVVQTVIGDNVNLAPTADADIYRVYLKSGDRLIADIDTDSDGPNTFLQILDESSIRAISADGSVAENDGELAPGYLNITPPSEVPSVSDSAGANGSLFDSVQTDAVTSIELLGLPQSGNFLTIDFGGQVMIFEFVAVGQPTQQPGAVPVEFPAGLTTPGEYMNLLSPVMSAEFLARNVLLDVQYEEFSSIVRLEAVEKDPFIDFTATIDGAYYVAVSHSGNETIYGDSYVNRAPVDSGTTGLYTLAMKTYTPRNFVLSNTVATTAPTAIDNLEAASVTLTLTQDLQETHPFFNAASPNQVTLPVGAINAANLSNGDQANPLAVIPGREARISNLLTSEHLGIHVLIQNVAEVSVNDPNVALDPEAGRETDQLRNETGLLLSWGSAATVLNNVFVNNHESIVLEVTSDPLITTLGDAPGRNDFFPNDPNAFGPDHPKPTQAVVVGNVFQDASWRRMQSQDLILSPDALNRTDSSTASPDYLGTSNVNGGLDDFNIIVGVDERVLEFPEANKFNPAPGAVVIDASVNSLLERQEVKAARASVGLPPTNVLAPNRDVSGLLRADHPDYAPPGGLGTLVFKDRGAVDLADFTGPVAVFGFPLDGDADLIDLDPNKSYIALEEGNYRDFKLQLLDTGDDSDPFIGSGINHATVLSSNSQQPGANVALFENSTLLVEGVDYAFDYDQSQNAITLTPTAGVWKNDAVYRIELNNRENAAVLTLPPASLINDGDVLDIIDGSDQRTVFEFDLGFAIDFPEVITFSVTPSGGLTEPINDGELFTVTDAGQGTVTFEFNEPGTTILAGNREIVLPPTPLIAADYDAYLELIAFNISEALKAVYEPLLTSPPRVVQTGREVAFAGELGTTAETSRTSLQQKARTVALLVSEVGVPDGTSFVVTQDDVEHVFEYDLDGASNGFPINIAGVLAGDIPAVTRDAIVASNLLSGEPQVIDTGSAGKFVWMDLGVEDQMRVNSGIGISVVGLSRPVQTGDAILVEHPALVQDGAQGSRELRFQVGPADPMLPAPSDPENVVTIDPWSSTDDISTAVLDAMRLSPNAISELPDVIGELFPGTGISIGGDPDLSIIASVPNLIEVSGEPGTSPSSTLNVIADVILQLPPNASGVIGDEEILVITADDGTEFVFEFDNDLVGSVFVPGAIPIPFTSSFTNFAMSQAIATEVNNQNMGVVATVVGTDLVSFGPIDADRVNPFGYLSPVGPRPGMTNADRLEESIKDGDTLTLSQGNVTVTYEFNFNVGGGGTTLGNIPINITANATTEELAQRIAESLTTQPEGLQLDPVYLGGSAVELNDVSGTQLVLNSNYIVNTGVAGGTVRVPILEGYTAQEIKVALISTINGPDAANLNVDARDRGIIGDTVSLFGGALYGGVAGPGGSFEVERISLIRDNQGNGLQANREGDLTAFTILMPGVQLDFGDAPDPLQTQSGRYATLLQNDGARHVVGYGPTLGQKIDAEIDASAGIEATGDDLTLKVVSETPLFTLAAGNHPGEIAIQVSDPLMPGINDGDILSIFTSNEASTVFEYDIETTLDGAFDDANIAIRPDPSNLTAESVAEALGAAIVSSGLSFSVNVLGSQVFVDADDEDGVDLISSVNPTGVLNQGVVTPITVNVEGSGVLEAYIDFNLDGDFDDAFEKVISGDTVAETGSSNFFFTGQPSTRTYNITVPSNAPVITEPLETYARFRVSSTLGLTSNGLAETGEVEDYLIRFLPGMPPQFPSGSIDANGNFVPLEYSLDEDSLLTALDSDGSDPSVEDGLLAGVTDPDAGDVPKIYSEDTTDVTGPRPLFRDGFPSQLAGLLTLNSDGTFSFAPEQDFNGTTTFTARVTDESVVDPDLALLNSVPMTVTLEVNPVNDPPVLIGASVISQTISEDTQHVFTIDAANVSQALVTDRYLPGPVDELYQPVRINEAGSRLILGSLDVITDNAGSAQVTFAANHDFEAGDSFFVTGASEAAYNVLHTVGSVVSPTEVVTNVIYTADAAGGQAESDSIYVTDLGGNVSVSRDGTTVTYTPPLNYNEDVPPSTPDQFTYSVIDRPNQLGAFASGGSTQNLVVDGTTAYVADGTAGLRVLDISNSVAISELGIFATSGNVRSVALDGETAFVANGPEGMLVLDVSDPAAITELDSTITLGDTRHIALNGTSAYLADGAGGVRVLDITNPASVVDTGAFGVVDARHVAADGTNIFVAAGAQGILVLDASDPNLIVLRGSSAESDSDANAVTIVGTTAYVADGMAGLRILDVSDLDNISQHSLFDTTGDAQSVTIDGSLAYVGNGLGGLVVLDVTDPLNPTQVARYQTDGFAMSNAMSFDSSKVYVASAEDGLVVVDVVSGFVPLVGPDVTTVQIVIEPVNDPPEIFDDAYSSIQDIPFVIPVVTPLTVDSIADNVSFVSLSFDSPHHLALGESFEISDSDVVAYNDVHTVTSVLNPNTVLTDIAFAGASTVGEVKSLFANDNAGPADEVQTLTLEPLPTYAIQGFVEAPSEAGKVQITFDSATILQVGDEFAVSDSGSVFYDGIHTVLAVESAEVVVIDTNFNGTASGGLANLWVTDAGGVVSYDSLNQLLTYSAALSFSGVDGFTYQVADADGLQAASPAEVTITVTGVDDAPVFEGVEGLKDSGGVPVDQITREEAKSGGAVMLYDVESWFSDPEGVALTFTLGSVIDGDAVFSAPPSVNGSELTLSLNEFIPGEASFEIIASDGVTPTAVMIDLTLEDTLDGPIIIGTISPLTANEDETVNADLSTVFFDPDGDVLTYRVVQVGDSLYGPGEGVGPNDDDLVKSIDTVNDDMTITLQPDQSGDVTIVLEASDNISLTANVQYTFELQVSPLGDAPVAVDDYYTVSLGSSLLVTIPNNGLLGNDYDVDGDEIELDDTDPVGISLAGGQIQLDTPKGMITIEPDGTFFYTNDDGSYHPPEALTAISDSGGSMQLETVEDHGFDAVDLPIEVAIEGTSSLLGYNTFHTVTQIIDARTLVTDTVYNGPSSMGTWRHVETDTFEYNIKDSGNTPSGNAKVMIRLDASAYQNPQVGFQADVNADGTVSPLDALKIINFISLNGEVAVSAIGTAPPDFLDTDGNGRVALNDILKVLSSLEQQNGGSGEGEFADIQGAARLGVSSSFVAASRNAMPVRNIESVSHRDVDTTLDQVLASGLELSTSSIESVVEGIDKAGWEEDAASVDSVDEALASVLDEIEVTISVD